MLLKGFYDIFVVLKFFHYSCLTFDLFRYNLYCSLGIGLYGLYQHVFSIMAVSFLA
jgi:hypothetical protein